MRLPAVTRGARLWAPACLPLIGQEREVASSNKQAHGPSYRLVAASGPPSGCVAPRVGCQSGNVSGQSDGLVLSLTWVLDAPREPVFRALSEPAALANWWGPSGFTVPEVELDFRVGGRYRFSMQPPGGDVFHLAGEFLEIDPPRRLAYTFRWEEPDPADQETVATLSLDTRGDHGDATRLSLSHGEFASQARLELHQNGWTESLVKLRELLGSG